MSEYVFKMPDLGEGTVEAEIVAWHTKVGDVVKEDQVIVEVMTDKAAVEVPSPVSGRILSLHGEPGDKVAVGAPLIVFDTSATAGVIAPAAAPAASPAPSPAAPPPAAPPPAPRRPAASPPASSVAPPPASPAAARPAATRVMASPATRRRAREAGIDLQDIVGSGPGGRILKGDVPPAGEPVAAPAAKGPQSPASPAPGDAGVTEIKVIGLRRVIAERMSEAKRTIPHFSYVEEIDVTELEDLRQHLNAGAGGKASLTYLPFLIVALTRALQEFPQCNALYDAARNTLLRHRAVHVGIATQTPDGLKVPVLRDAQSQDLWQLASQVKLVSERARRNQSTRQELTGSTITVTSLGKLGGIASTPVINLPEVSIIGLNRAVERPVVHRGAIVIRRMMNLSSSFDHRFVDGHDAAAMIQSLKEMLEHPATLFIPKSLP
ncbi:MAG: dihydrolipoamide acetyltransferase family protein [Steroidobacteraceae bacterium]